MRRRVCVVPAIACVILAACSREPRDPATTPEAHVLNAYLQAATCVALRASPEEKARLTAGLPFIDRSLSPPDVAAYLSDIYEVLPRRAEAEKSLGLLLPQRCPETADLIRTYEAQMPAEPRAILESQFLDIVSTVVAASSAPPQDLRQFFELHYRAIGGREAPY